MTVSNQTEEGEGSKAFFPVSTSSTKPWHSFPVTVLAAIDPCAGGASHFSEAQLSQPGRGCWRERGNGQVFRRPSGALFLCAPGLRWQLGQIFPDMTLSLSTGRATPVLMLDPFALLLLPPTPKSLWDPSHRSREGRQAAWLPWKQESLLKQPVAMEITMALRL